MFTGRHLTASNSLQQQTGVRLTGHDCRTRITALLQKANQSQVETAFDFFGRSVTVKAMSSKDGPDISFKRKLFRGYHRIHLQGGKQARKNDTASESQLEHAKAWCTKRRT
jgi:hypothetical protein